MMHRFVLMFALVVCLTSGADQPEPKVFFQSHRGGLEEAPENTLLAVEKSWAIPGAVPEIDLRTTSDGVIVCIHDATPERTVTPGDPQAKTPIESMTYEQVKQLDAGGRFSEPFWGTAVPALDDIFIRMVGHPEREIYLDLKAVDVDALVAKITQFNLRDRVWFVHGAPAMCEKLSMLWPGARVMTWISAKPEMLKKQFARMEEKNFHGVKQLQFHLPTEDPGPPIRYALDDAYLKECMEKLEARGIAFQLRLFDFDAASLRRLIDLGVHWYVTDAPAAFHQSVQEALALP